MHHASSRVPVLSLAGTNVARDFVELPSQIFENWCWEREALDRFARHHETDVPIPGAFAELAALAVKQLQADKVTAADQPRQIVSDLSYLGDEGGIMCHIARPDSEGRVIISLTHVRLPRSMPLAQAVADYQKHRVKKLKKQAWT